VRSDANRPLREDLGYQEPCRGPLDEDLRSQALALAAVPSKQRLKLRQRPSLAKACLTLESGAIGWKALWPSGGALMTSRTVPCGGVAQPR
jgi:hypothetical protein